MATGNEEFRGIKMRSGPVSDLPPLEVQSAIELAHGLYIDLLILWAKELASQSVSSREEEQQLAEFCRLATEVGEYTWQHTPPLVLLEDSIYFNPYYYKTKQNTDSNSYHQVTSNLLSTGKAPTVAALLPLSSTQDDNQSSNGQTFKIKGILYAVEQKEIALINLFLKDNHLLLDLAERYPEIIATLLQHEEVAERISDLTFAGLLSRLTEEEGFLTLIKKNANLVDRSCKARVAKMISHPYEVLRHESFRETISDKPYYITLLNRLSYSELKSLEQSVPGLLKNVDSTKLRAKSVMALREKAFQEEDFQEHELIPLIHDLPLSDEYDQWPNQSYIDPLMEAIGQPEFIKKISVALLVKLFNHVPKGHFHQLPSELSDYWMKTIQDERLVKAIEQPYQFLVGLTTLPIQLKANTILTLFNRLRPSEWQSLKTLPQFSALWEQYEEACKADAQPVLLPLPALTNIDYLRAISDDDLVTNLNSANRTGIMDTVLGEADHQEVNLIHWLTGYANQYSSRMNMSKAHRYLTIDLKYNQYLDDARPFYKLPNRIPREPTTKESMDKELLVKRISKLPLECLDKIETPFPLLCIPELVEELDDVQLATLLRNAKPRRHVEILDHMGQYNDNSALVKKVKNGHFHEGYFLAKYNDKWMMKRVDRLGRFSYKEVTAYEGLQDIHDRYLGEREEWRIKGYNYHHEIERQIYKALGESTETPGLNTLCYVNPALKARMNDKFLYYFLYACLRKDFAGYQARETAYEIFNNKMFIDTLLESEISKHYHPDAYLLAAGDVEVARQLLSRCPKMFNRDELHSLFVQYSINYIDTEGKFIADSNLYIDTHLKFARKGHEVVHLAWMLEKRANKKEEMMDLPDDHQYHKCSIKGHEELLRRRAEYDKRIEEAGKNRKWYKKVGDFWLRLYRSAVVEYTIGILTFPFLVVKILFDALKDQYRYWKNNTSFDQEFNEGQIFLDERANLRKLKKERQVELQGKKADYTDGDILQGAGHRPPWQLNNGWKENDITIDISDETSYRPLFEPPKKKNHYEKPLPYDQDAAEAYCKEMQARYKTPFVSVR